MYKYNNGRFKELLAWWDDKAVINNYDDGDIVFHIQNDKPIGKYNYQFYTLEIDLNKSIDQIRSEYNSTTKREVIKKSELFEHVVIDVVNQKVIDEYVKCFNSFAHYKGLQQTSVELIKQMADDKKLMISQIYYDGELIRWHSYYTDGQRMRLYHSFPTNHKSAKINGLANVCHLDFDIQTGIKKGIKIYDFGGAGNVDGDNTRFNGIINFKKKFTKCEKIYWKGVTPIGTNGELVYEKYFKKH